MLRLVNLDHVYTSRQGKPGLVCTPLPCSQENLAMSEDIFDYYSLGEGVFFMNQMGKSQRCC
jgi:hypothetical protein